MDRRLLGVVGVSLLFGLVVSSLFYGAVTRASLRRAQQPRVETARIVVASVSLPVGVEIRPEAVKLVEVPKDRVPHGAFHRIEEVVGRPVLHKIFPDEPVVSARLGERGTGLGVASVIPTGMRAMAVRVNEVAGVAGFVFPGAKVDVLATLRLPGDDMPKTVTVLQNVSVAAAGHELQPDGSGKAVNVPVVTLLVTPAQAEVLSLVSNEGRIQLSLRNSSDTDMVSTTGHSLAQLYGLRPRSETHRPRSAQPAPLPSLTDKPQPASDTVVVIRGTKVSVEPIVPSRKEP